MSVAHTGAADHVIHKNNPVIPHNLLFVHKYVNQDEAFSLTGMCRNIICPPKEVKHKQRFYFVFVFFVFCNANNQPLN